jgi:hypothetical protein
VSDGSTPLNALQQRAFHKDACAPGSYPFASLTENLLAFCEGLRLEHQFRIGSGEVADALRALEVIGVDDLERVRVALKTVCCGKFEETIVFDSAFKDFFFPAPQGVAQEGLLPLEDKPRPARPGDQRADQANQRSPQAVQPPGQGDDQDDQLEGTSARHTPTEDDPAAAYMERVMRARYSAMEAESSAAQIDRDGLPEMLRAAEKLVSSLRLGHSRRWRMTPRGPRFDFRRTLRSSLATGGDAIHPRWLGHPRRNPRILVLLDGSRSMLDHAGTVLQFAYALAMRSRRVDVFTFSTALKDVTRDLRKLSQAHSGSGHVRLELVPSGRAWGGGTRIGASLKALLKDHAARVLTPDTLVIISSDGLDVGEVDQLEQAMRELKRRSAGIVWLNPLCATPGFQPTARGMKAAMPFITTLTSALNPNQFSSLAETVRLR